MMGLGEMGKLQLAFYRENPFAIKFSEVMLKGNPREELT